MKLTLHRIDLRPECTLGHLYIDGKMVCWTLEDVVREGPKVYGQTAIPAGDYAVIVTPSARFKRPLPLLLDVPGFSGVRIHTGNTQADTEGCILLGMLRHGDTILKSRFAFDLVYPAIVEALKTRPLTLTITDEFERAVA